jgi:predicted nucleic acid-binding protein
MATVFVDTNVLLRHLLQDVPDQSSRASAFLARLERGEFSARIAETVVFETVFNLQRRHGVTKAAIRAELLPLIDLSGIELPGKHRLRRTFELYVDANMSFADAYHVAIMEQLGIEEIASFDTDFDRVPGIRRREPA